MNAESDDILALQEVESFATASLALPAATPEFQTAKQILTRNLADLKECRRIHGVLPSLDNVLDPQDEVVEDKQEAMPTDEEVIKKVKYDMAIEHREIIEIQDDDEEEDDAHEGIQLMTTEGITLIQKLEAFLTTQGDVMYLVLQLWKV
ncbi:hypothetical protein C8J57DRAFT_1222021 [Mycena rebaudengoi]|nr:hypothetical protein C8J57DRAFT_1222021 [Mycena rebaudengoi]